MSIRPIDIQIAIHKTDQHTKEFNTNSKVAINQQGITNELQKQVSRNQKQVVSTERSRYKKISRDSEEKSNSNRKQQKNKRRGKQDKGSNVDITV